MTTRRELLRLAALSAGGTVLAAPPDTVKARFPIGACDWSLRKAQDVAAFDVAKSIGLSGMQVSFSTPGADFDLRDPKVREHYYRRVDETGIAIASLGMAILNQRPLATDPDSIDWVADSVSTLAHMRDERPQDAPTICLLAFFGKGDINGKPEAFDAVVRRLKPAAKRAEDHGVILGIESYLSADDHLRLIEEVGSPAVQVYYDSANSNKMGYDIYEEVKQIGGDRICQVHCKENKGLITEGVVDFERFADSLIDAGYTDWLIIEGSLPKEMDLVEAYQKNRTQLERIFHPR